jgi:hypothetical protein
MCHIAPESVSQRLDRQHDCGLRARNPPAQSPKSLKERGQVKEPAAPAYLQLCRARGQCKTANSSCQMKVLAFAATADLAGGEWLSYDKVSQAPPRWMACTIGTRSQIYEGTFGVKEFWPDRRSLKKYIESSTFQILLETL